MENSKIIRVESGHKGPVIGLVGLVHGDESCGRIILDELQNTKPKKGTIKLIYANLPAEQAAKRKVEADLNRVFPGKKDGKLEEMIAFELRDELKECDYVLDIHSSTDKTPAFAISTVDSPEFYELARQTGLDRYVLMTDKLATGKSLIDFVNAQGRKGISFEAGYMKDENSIKTARDVVYNFLINNGIIEGTSRLSNPEKFYAHSIITAPSKDFICYTPECFKLLKAGTAYGRFDNKEYSLDQDCYPILSVSKPFEEINMVFIACRKN